MPISIFCVCPEEAYLNDQASAKELMADGYGLLTVAADGQVQKRATATRLCSKFRIRNSRPNYPACRPQFDAGSPSFFDRYQHNAPSGVADISEVLEGLVLRAGRDAARKKIIAASDAKPGAPAITLSALLATKQGQNAGSGDCGAQSYIAMYRNTAHHFPKNKSRHFANIEIADMVSWMD